MKLLMIIVDTKCREEVEVLFQHNGITGYSEIPNAHGVGESGVRMGSSAHPKTSSIFFTIVESGQVEPLKKALCSYCKACEKNMRMIQWAVEDVA
ncbi:MAG: hypothetical protein LJE93_11215 [Acidobacteria bacterium]|jgi:hypothetical protein|nr:hypothetical protein [Acidobacteriota bacterium]